MEKTGKTQLIVVLSLMLAVLAVSGCKEEAEAAPEEASPAAETAAPEAAPRKAEEQTRPRLVGRCENESSDVPYGSLYFYPEKKELFFTLNNAASRVPVTVSKEDEKAVEFSYKWAPDAETAATSAAATASWIGTQKWSFAFDSLKNSICHPVEDDLFYKNLTELGLKAGKYLDSRNNDMIEVLPDAQKLVSEENGKTNIVYYRVRSKSDDVGVTVYGSFEQPSDSKSQLWAEWVFTALGEDIVVKYNDKITRRYAAVK